MDGCFTTFASNRSRRKPEIPAVLEPVSPGLVVCILNGSFIAISFLCTFYMGTTALLASALIVLLILMVTAEDAAAVARSRYPSISALVVMAMVSSGFAVFLGAQNYHENYAPYRASREGRQYRNVAADAPASAYRDAGTIHFNDSFLDDTHALGWRGHDYVYCVAPIAQKHAILLGNEAPPPFQFWAVGLDCCSSRGVFHCDGAGEFEASGGVVLQDPDPIVSDILSPSRSYHESYLKAVAAACALYDVESAEVPVLLHWVSNTDHFLASYWRWAVLNFLIGAAVQFIIVFLLWSVIHGYYDQHVRKAIGMDYTLPPRGRATSSLASSGAPAAAAPPRKEPGLVQPKADPFLLP